MNKRFIKDNSRLFTALGGAALVALILLILAVIGYAKWFSYSSQAEEMRSTIAGLIRQKPAPVEGNVAPMTEDTEFYRQKLDEMLPYFGQYKEKALDAFVRELGVDKKEFLEAFRKAWNSDEDRKAQGGQSRFYQRFMSGLLPGNNWSENTPYKTPEERRAAWERACKAFKEAYQPLTIEQVNDGNLPGILFTMLGVPRSYSGRGDWCMQRFMVPMRSRMLDVCANPPAPARPEKPAGETTPGDQEKESEAPTKMDVLGSAGSFGFNYKTNPKPEEIPDIVRNWEVVGDLVRRMVVEGLSSLNSFNIRSISGEKQGRYVIYHYTFSVTGDIGRIRSFVKNLNDSVRENRMYVIRSIFLYADRDGAQEIFLERQREADLKRAELDGTAEADNAKDRGRRGRRGGKGRQEKRQEKPDAMEAARLREAELQKPYDKRAGYGQILFGGSPNCEAVFDVEYVFVPERVLD